MAETTFSNAVSAQYEYYKGLTIEELETHFSSPQMESESIEFKTGEYKLDSLFKEVCALTNTNGGIVIIGTPKEDYQYQYAKEKVCMGKLIPCKEDRTTDSFIQSIMSGIAPAPVGVKVHKIKHPEGFVYIIYVPKSRKPPHQVKGRYYIRVGTMSEPAPHGIVEALMNQKIPVQLKQNVQIVKSDHFFSENPDAYDIGVQISNGSFYPAKECEMYFAIAGKVREFNAKEDFKAQLLEGGKSCLYNTFSNKQSLVPHIWWQRNFCIIFKGEYLYMQLILWALDTPAIGILYKYHVTEGLSEYNLYEDSPQQREFYSWIRNEE